MSDQIAIPVDVPLPEIERKKSLGQALVMCMELAGFDQDKAAPIKGLDPAQFSRWKSGQEGIKWDKFAALMDGCGNDAPLLWMLHQRGYDLNSLRKRETETERENRLLREENAALRRSLQRTLA